LSGRIVSIDLDARSSPDRSIRCSTGRNPFVILHGGNASNPCPFNGSLFMLRAGAHPEVWGDFSLRQRRRGAAPRVS
jgi:hypothetical protein